MINPERSDPQRLHVLVTGRVQGVGFRAFVQQAGSLLRLSGWVRNVGYNQVEALAEGPRPALEQFLSAVRDGPPGSRVDEAHADWELPTGEFTGFTVRSSR